jgi:hypothetical protein
VLGLLILCRPDLARTHQSSCRWLHKSFSYAQGPIAVRGTAALWTQQQWSTEDPRVNSDKHSDLLLSTIASSAVPACTAACTNKQGLGTRPETQGPETMLDFTGPAVTRAHQRYVGFTLEVLLTA